MHAHKSLLYTWPCTNIYSFMLFNTAPGSPTFTLSCKLIALFIHELGYSHHLAHYNHAHASNLIYRQSLACYTNLHTYPLTILHPHSIAFPHTLKTSNANISLCCTLLWHVQMISVYALPVHSCFFLFLLPRIPPQMQIFTLLHKFTACPLTFLCDSKSVHSHLNSHSGNLTCSYNVTLKTDSLALFCTLKTLACFHQQKYLYHHVNSFQRFH